MTALSNDLTAVQAPDRDHSLAQEIKAIRKKRFQREVFQDPSLAKQLVKAQASPIYNASGEIIQAVSGDLGDA
ncbi:MAG: hypothetical protein PHV85_09200 [Desulfovibrionaceae bacterium]|nr:hypothetical protein [Desulfovibrionaceae bacterium]